MTSKVLVKLPTVPFSQGKKPPPELVPVSNRHEGNAQAKQRGVSGDRVAQLEQNMKFLQEQHQATLVALHQEVENLRQKNRDLQFQLVFSKGNACASSSPSSPEENGNGFMKSKGSPMCVNVTPLQVELLERDLQDIKFSLNEAKTHNLYLSEIIEQQKKMLDLAEGQTKLMVADVGIQVGGGIDRAHAGLVMRLQDAEAMVKRLQRENEEQSKEIASVKAAASNASGNRRGGSRNGQSNNHSRAVTGESSQDEGTNKFPPLQSQSYWHRGSKGNHSFDNSHSNYYRNGKNRHERNDRDSDVDETVLPQLRNGNNKADNSSSYPPFYRSRGYHSGNYYGGNRKYRGNRSQRDRRDTDSREHRREYNKEREPKDQRPEFSDSTEGTKDCKTSRKP